jgi:serine/threonine protein kinase
MYDVVKVLDFGRVKEFRSPDPALSQFDALIGTPLFMSSERSRRRPTSAPRATFTRWAPSAYYLTSGSHVFEAASLWEITARHLMTVPDPLPPEVPPPLAKLVLECLAKKPENRPGGAATLERSFNSILEREGWSQESAQVWWRDHGEQVVRSRRARSSAGVADPVVSVLRTAAH